MRIKKWVLAAAAVAVAIALTGCPSPVRPEAPPPGAEPVWTTIFDLVEHLDRFTLGVVTGEALWEGVPLTNAGSPTLTIIEVDGERALQVGTVQDWSGIDILHTHATAPGFNFQAGDTIALAGNSGTSGALGLGFGQESDWMAGWRSDPGEDFDEEFTLTAPQIAQMVSAAGPNGLRIRGPNDNSVFTLTSLVVEGYRAPGAVEPPPPPVIPEEEEEEIDLSAATGGFLGIAESDGTDMYKVTYRGDFVGLRMALDNDGHGLDIVWSPGIFANVVDMVSGRVVTVGGTYTVRIAGVVPEDFPAGHQIRIMGLPGFNWVNNSVAPDTDGEFSLERDFVIPATHGDAANAGPWSRARIGSVATGGATWAANSFTLTGVEILNSGGEVVWDMEEVLTHPSGMLPGAIGFTALDPPEGVGLAGGRVTGLIGGESVDGIQILVSTDRFALADGTLVPVTVTLGTGIGGSVSLLAPPSHIPINSAPFLVTLEGNVGNNVAGDIALLTVNALGITETLRATVIPRPTSVVIDPPTANFMAGVAGTETFVATVLPATVTGVPAAPQGVTWSVTSNPVQTTTNAVAIAQTGVLTITAAAIASTVTVTATSDIGAVVGTATVSIHPEGSVLLLAYPSTVNIRAGGTAGNTVTLEITAFNLNVTAGNHPFATMFTGLPAGVTASGNLTVDASGSGTSTVTLTATSVANVADNISVTSTFGGSTGEVFTLNIAVPLGPVFSLAALLAGPPPVTDFAALAPNVTGNDAGDRFAVADGGVNITNRTGNWQGLNILQEAVPGMNVTSYLYTVRVVGVVGAHGGGQLNIQQGDTWLGVNPAFPTGTDVAFDLTSAAIPATADFSAAPIRIQTNGGTASTADLRITEVLITRTGPRP